MGLTDLSSCAGCSGTYSVKLDWVNGDTEQTVVYRGGLNVQTLGVGVTTWTDSGGTLGIENGYVLKHWNGTLESTGISDSLTPDPCLDDLSTPTGAGLSVISDTQINITPTGGGVDVAYFNIYVAGGALIQQISVATGTYNHTGRSPGTQYSYDIEAESATGCKSAKLTAQSAYTKLATPAAPTVVATGANSINITCPAFGTGADRYRVFYAGGAEVGTVTNPATPLTDPNTLTPGTLYSYEIQAEDSTAARGTSSKSTSNGATTQTGTVTAVDAVHSLVDCPNASIDITWSVGTNNSATIKIERKKPSDGDYTNLVTGLAAGTQVYEDTTHNELAGTGTTYYRVSFESITGGTPGTDGVTVSCLPAAPFGSDVSSVSSTVTVTWNDASTVPAETGFKLYRAPNVGGVPGTWALQDTVGAGLETWDDVGVAPGFYHYSVTSYNATGESSKNECASNPVEVVW
jgi:hypothetical protein